MKFKIWLHFQQLLKTHKTDQNDCECIDVTLSLYTQPSIQLVFRMQEIQMEITHINYKLFNRLIKEEQIPDKQEELRLLLEK